MSTKTTQPVRYGDQIELEISSLAFGGDSVGRYQDFALFIPGGLPGERVRVKVTGVKEHYATAEILSILRPSPERVTPACGIFEECGGCQWQHLHYSSQLKTKRQFVVDALSRIGRLPHVTVQPCLPSPAPYAYRNKAMPVVSMRDGHFVTGIYEPRSHHLVPYHTCPIQAEEINALLQKVIGKIERSGLTPYQEKKHEGFLRHLAVRRGMKTGETLLAFVTRTEVPEERVQKPLLPPEGLGDILPRIARELAAEVPGLVGVLQNINSSRTNIVFGPSTRVLAGRDHYFEVIDGLRLKVSLHSFLQVNTAQADILHALVREALGEPKHQKKWGTVLDLYSGIGTLALAVSDQADYIVGVEEVGAAVDDARFNAELNHKGNIDYLEGDVPPILLGLKDKGLGQIDAAILDPPRKGVLPEVLARVTAFHPERLVYVSCDPATLARDLALLVKHGYSVDWAQPLDMFPQTYHVETVVKLTRETPLPTELLAQEGRLELEPFRLPKPVEPASLNISANFNTLKEKTAELLRAGAGGAWAAGALAGSVLMAAAGGVGRAFNAAAKAAGSVWKPRPKAPGTAPENPGAARSSLTAPPQEAPGSSPAWFNPPAWPDAGEGNRATAWSKDEPGKPVDGSFPMAPQASLVEEETADPMEASVEKIEEALGASLPAQGAVPPVPPVSFPEPTISESMPPSLTQAPEALAETVPELEEKPMEHGGTEPPPAVPDKESPTAVSPHPLPESPEASAPPVEVPGSSVLEGAPERLSGASPPALKPPLAAAVPPAPAPQAGSTSSPGSAQATPGAPQAGSTSSPQATLETPLEIPAPGHQPRWSWKIPRFRISFLPLLQWFLGPKAIRWALAAGFLAGGVLIAKATLSSESPKLGVLAPNVAQMIPDVIAVMPTRNFLRYELVPFEVRINHEQMGSFPDMHATVEVFQEGKPVSIVDDRTKIGLSKDTAHGRFTGNWPIPYNPSPGTYVAEVEISSPSWDKPKVFESAFTIAPLKPSGMIPGYAALTMEGGKQLIGGAVPALDGSDSLRAANAIDWAKFMGANVYAYLMGQTSVWDRLNAKDFPFSRTDMEVGRKYAKAAHAAGLKFAAYMTTFKVVGDAWNQAPYNFSLGYDPDTDEVVQSRFISLEDPKRRQDILDFLEQMNGDPDVDMVGLDYVRTGDAGYEMVDEFVNDMAPPVPEGYGSFSRQDRIHWLAKTVERKEDRQVLALFDWWRAHKVALTLRNILEEAKMTKPVFTFTLGWQMGHEHGQDPAMDVDAGVNFNQIMLYQGDRGTLKSMEKQWPEYLSHGSGMYAMGEMVDFNWVQKSLDPPGPEELYDREVETLRNWFPVNSSLGMFWHDLYRIVYGVKGPYSSMEWLVAGGKAFTTLRQVEGLEPLEVSILAPKRVPAGVPVPFRVEIHNTSAVDLKGLVLHQIDASKDYDTDLARVGPFDLPAGEILRVKGLFINIPKEDRPERDNRFMTAVMVEKPGEDLKAFDFAYLKKSNAPALKGMDMDQDGDSPKKDD